MTSSSGCKTLLSSESFESSSCQVTYTLLLWDRSRPCITRSPTKSSRLWTTVSCSTWSGESLRGQDLGVRHISHEPSYDLPVRPSLTRHHRSVPLRSTTSSRLINTGRCIVRPFFATGTPNSETVLLTSHCVIFLPTLLQTTIPTRFRYVALIVHCTSASVVDRQFIRSCPCSKSTLTAALESECNTSWTNGITLCSTLIIKAMNSIWTSWLRSKRVKARPRRECI
jgi:hypothetical protein